MSRRAIVVCSRNRGEVLATLLDWLFEIAPPASRIIVVEASDPGLRLPPEFVQRKVELGLEYLESRAQLTHQRNLALEALRGEEFVHFIDDDAWPARGYFADIETVLLAYPHGAGAGGVPIYPEATPPAPHRFFKSMFLLDSRHSGRLLRSGTNVPFRGLEGTRSVDWLAGCAMSFRVALIEGLRFDEARKGVGWGEDVDFSLRASERGPLFICPNAVIEHRMSPLGRDTYERMIEENDLNRILLGLDFPGHVKGAAIRWSLLGRAFVQVATDLSMEAEIFGRRSALGNSPRVVAGSLRRSLARSRRLHARAATMVRDRVRDASEAPGEGALDRPVAVRLTGGVGNQLFGFACAYAQARRLGTYVQLETDPAVNDPTRPLSLEPLVDGHRIRLGAEPSELDFVELGFTYDRRAEEIGRGTRMIGYFQSWRYFQGCAEEIRERLRACADATGGSGASTAGFRHIAVQVRRGDYLQQRVHRYHGTCTERYYLQGVEEIRAEVGPLPVIVYTDDPEFGQHLTDRIDAASLDRPGQGDTPLSTLLRLSRASAFVISNSSFGWWGAWLAQEPQVVIAPEPWFGHARLDTRDLLPPSWRTLNREEP